MRKVVLAAGLAMSLTVVAADTQDSSTLVVAQGTARVTLGDVDAYVNRIPASDRAGFLVKPERIETMLRNMLLDKQLADEARKLGLDKDPVVQQQIALAVENALSRVRVEAFRDSLKTPDFNEQAAEEFQANKQKYAQPARHDVKHILIDIKSRTPEEAEALAKQVAEKLAKDPAQFDALVESTSDDESKKDNQGLIENASSTAFVKPFAEAASKLTKVGELTAPVRTQYGFHILKLVKLDPPKVPAFEEVRESIVSRLGAEWMEQQIRGHLDGLRNQPMDPQPEVLATLRDRFPAPAAAAAPAPRQ